MYFYFVFLKTHISSTEFVFLNKSKCILSHSNVNVYNSDYYNPRRRDRNSATSRTSGHVGGHKPGDEDPGGWPPGLLLPSLSGSGLCPSASCVMTSVSLTSVLLLLGVSYITTQLHTRVTDLEHQLR